MGRGEIREKGFLNSTSSQIPHHPTVFQYLVKNLETSLLEATNNCRKHYSLTESLNMRDKGSVEKNDVVI